MADDEPLTRLLHASPSSTPIHIYTIPPLTSTRGFSASSWTAPPRPTAKEIFTARIRVLETSHNDKISVVIHLEDPSTGDLFAAAPYTSEAVVQQANDSSRFFAIRVQGEGGMKATLGLGFEERGAALDFNIALTEARKVLGWERAVHSQGVGEEVGRKDFSLKEGEKIHIPLSVGGGKGRRGKEVGSAGEAGEEGRALFSIAPPPSSLGKKTQAEELGFDDGEFGEFQ